MKVGVVLNTQFLPSEDPVLRTRELLEQVRYCRDSGFDSVHVVQHFLSQPFAALQLWPTLGRIAAEAGEMSVGSSIFLLTLLNPVYAAEHAITMDVLTEGRFIFGVGLGFRKEEFEVFGVEPSTRAARFNESMALLLPLLQGETVSHEGRFFVLSDAAILPSAVQRPHPPVWMAASGDLGVQRAARWGVSWLINPHSTVDTVRRQLDLYHETAEQHGHEKPVDQPAFREVSVSLDRSDAMATAHNYLERKYAAYATWGLDRTLSSDERLSAPIEDLARGRFIVGDPDDCLETIRDYEERLGMTHLLARIQWPGMPHSQAMKQLEILSERVLPSLRSSERALSGP